MEDKATMNLKQASAESVSYVSSADVFAFKVRQATQTASNRPSESPCLTSMPAEIILNITSHLHFPDRRALLNTCRTLRHNKQAWKAAYLNQECEWAAALKEVVEGHGPLRRFISREDLIEDLAEDNLKALGYTDADVRALASDRAFCCFGCNRLLSADNFATNGRFRDMNRPVPYMDLDEIFNATHPNSGSRRCMDCLGQEGLPNPDEPWLIHVAHQATLMHKGLMDRGYCRRCRQVFEEPYGDIDRRRRRELTCEECWDADPEQMAWAARRVDWEN
ncbi:uncharacterized protein AB675_7835 [Cyphellophora attinorum]|uniref:F-box domain-containing protein n=1 Tax=Cyphellophora attinorum TaxID=1664694 RepID=A0A0N1HV87_9EURO|nr:uncharacterized protein AB675_7835 [Phialophora attinorum]KPI41116.1 hypothetical protein AB675_7835 [Phialophora attinorum]